MTLDELCATATLKDGGYHRFPAPYHQMSVTLEEAQLLYALVRATRPRNVLELGTGLGLSAFFIASALQVNGDEGYVLTLEPEGNLAHQAKKLLQGLPATVIKPSPVKAEFPDLVYIDSAQSRRATDMKTWLTNGYSGPILVNDAERQYPELEAGAGVYLPTANGMWLGRAK